MTFGTPGSPYSDPSSGPPGGGGPGGWSGAPGAYPGSGAPSGYPQQQGGYGYGGAAPAKRGFDPSAVKPFDWAVLGAAVLAFIFSFFGYYSYDAKGEAAAACKNADSLSGIEKDLCGGDSASAWHGFFGWFGVLLVLVAAALVALAVFAPQVRLPFPSKLVALGAAALGVISVLLSLLVIPDWPPVSDLAVSDSDYDKNIDNGIGFSWYIVLILALVVAVLCFLSFQQSGGMSARSAGSGPGAAGGYGAPGGYGAAPGGQGAPGGQSGPGAPGAPAGGGYGGGYGGQSAPPQGPPQSPQGPQQQGPPQQGGYGPPPGGYSPPPPAAPPGAGGSAGGYQPPPPSGYTPPPQQ